MMTEATAVTTDENKNEVAGTDTLAVERNDPGSTSESLDNSCSAGEVGQSENDGPGPLAVVDHEVPLETPQENPNQTEESCAVPRGPEGKAINPGLEESQEEKKDDSKEAPGTSENNLNEEQKGASSEGETGRREREPQNDPPLTDRGRLGPQSPPHQHYPRQQAPGRLYASTEIVQSLFGLSVGLCWGDFSCQYNHVRGRLYASSESVLFYSNLFGFEKKINLRYETVTEMSLYRQTSIQVSVQDESNKRDEPSNESINNFIFKGFTDRVQTLRLLIELWGHCRVDDCMEVQETDASEGANLLTTQEPSTEPSQSLSPASRRPEPDKSQAVARQNAEPLPPSILRTPKVPTLPTPRGSPTIMDTLFNSNSILPDSLAPSRKRSKSVPNLHKRERRERRHSEVDEKSSDAGSAIQSNDESFGWDSATMKSDQAEWEAAKKVAEPWINEVGVEPFVLTCSLGAFFKLFLADDAAYSVDKFQRGESVKDLDVKITPWVQDPLKSNTLLRTIKFRHPCASFGVGPSHAPTTKHQQLRRYPGCGICITSSTTVEGLPGADCFVVNDLWLIEAAVGNDTQSSNPRITFSTRFGANFTKRTFLKSIIQKNIKAGNREWFGRYREMVVSVLKENRHLDAVQKAPESDKSMQTIEDAQAKEVCMGHPFQHMLLDGRTPLVLLIVLQFLFLLLLLFVVMNELRASHRLTEGLLQEMQLLRLEHGEVLGLLLNRQEEEWHGVR